MVEDDVLDDGCDDDGFMNMCHIPGDVDGEYVEIYKIDTVSVEAIDQAPDPDDVNVTPWTDAEYELANKSLYFKATIYACWNCGTVNAEKRMCGVKGTWFLKPKNEDDYNVEYNKAYEEIINATERICYNLHKYKKYFVKA